MINKSIPYIIILLLSLLSYILYQNNKYINLKLDNSNEVVKELTLEVTKVTNTINSLSNNIKNRDKQVRANMDELQRSLDELDKVKDDGCYYKSHDPELNRLYNNSLQEYNQSLSLPSTQ